MRKKGGHTSAFLMRWSDVAWVPGTCRANRNISTLIGRSTTGTDTTDVKHRTSKWRAGHRASPHAGRRLAYSRELPLIAADEEEAR